MSTTATKPTVNATIVRTKSNGVDFYSAQYRIKERPGLRFITNKEMDAILNGGQLEEFRSALPAWVGTGAFYEAPGKEIGSTIEYKSCNNGKVVVEVPKKFQGMKDTALVLEHPEYTLEKGANGLYVFKIHQPDKIQVVENFPDWDGYHNVHERTGIPIRREVSAYNAAARYLWRQDNLPWVGPLARGDFVWGADGCRDVYAYGWPDFALGVVGVQGHETASPQNSAVNKSINMPAETLNLLRNE